MTNKQLDQLLRDIDRARVRGEWKLFLFALKELNDLVDDPKAWPEEIKEFVASATP